MSIFNQASSRINMTSSGDLTLTSITLKDAGSYSCLAANQAGERQAVATLTVMQPPTFRGAPEDVQVRGRGRVEQFKGSCTAVV